MDRRGFANIFLLVFIFIASAFGNLISYHRSAPSVLESATNTTTTTASSSSLSHKSQSIATSSRDLLTMLDQLDNFPEQSCPRPPNRFTVVRLQYIRTQISGSSRIPIFHYPGTTVDTSRTTSSIVEKKLEALPPNTLIDIYTYAILQFGPGSGGYSIENEVVRCFNIVVS